jgi:hypothetical protein
MSQRALADSDCKIDLEMTDMISLHWYAESSLKYLPHKEVTVRAIVSLKFKP